MASPSRRRFAVLEAEHNEIWAGWTLRLWQQALGQAGDEWTLYQCHRGEFPAAEDVHVFDLVVIGGSRHSCNDEVAWISRVKELIPLYAKRARRLAGCCFGSQVIAAALGGTVGDNPSGRFVLGCETVTMSHELRQYPHLWNALVESQPPGKQVWNLWAAHGEQALQLPEGAVVLASSSNTKHELWHIGPNVLGWQFHPEFSGKLMHEKVLPRLVDVRRLSPEEAAASEQQLLHSQPDESSIRAMLQAFIQHGVTREA